MPTNPSRRGKDIVIEEESDIQGFTELGLSPEAALTAEAEAERQIALAEEEVEAGEVRVNFRWGRRQLNMVKQAAAAAGIPYQLYIKHVLYDRAAADLAREKAI